MKEQRVVAHTDAETTNSATKILCTLLCYVCKDNIVQSEDIVPSRPRSFASPISECCLQPLQRLLVYLSASQSMVVICSVLFAK